MKETINKNAWLIVFILFTILGCLFGGCKSDGFDKLAPPVIVIGIEKPKNIQSPDMADYYKKGSILLKDSSGKIWSCSGGNATSDALIESYNLGDTIK